MLANLANLIPELSKPIDPQYLETRKQGGQELTYVPWHRVAQILNEQASGWSYHYVGAPFSYETTTKPYDNGTTVKPSRSETRVSVEVALTIEGVTRCARGEEICTEFDGYGDPISNASSMALRRAAAMFGIGLYLYIKDAPKAQARPAAAQPANATPASGNVTVGFGKSKGMTPSQLADNDLAWYTKVYTENVNDASKQNFRASNQIILNALLADPRNGGLSDEGDLP